MPYITSLDGKKIWYDVTGKGEPLVLIGGSSLVRRQWDFLVPILQDHFKVILYDQRGAGLSDRSPEGITVDHNIFYQHSLFFPQHLPRNILSKRNPYLLYNLWRNSTSCPNCKFTVFKH